MLDARLLGRGEDTCHEMFASPSKECLAGFVSAAEFVLAAMFLKGLRKL